MRVVREIDTLEELVDYRDDWLRLLDVTPGATFFHSFPWLRTYWKHFGEDQRLRVLLVGRHDDEVCGIVPLVVRQDQTKVGRFRTLTYPLDDWGSFYGPLGADTAATLPAALAHIRHTRRDWNLLDLRWVDARGTDHGATPRAMRQAGFRESGQQWNRTTLVELSGTWDEYWRSRSKRCRENIRHKRKRLTKGGELQYVRYRPDATAGQLDPRWDLYDTCVELAHRSWQGDSPDGTTLSHDAVRDYLRDAHQAAASAGAVDLNLLYQDGRAVAFAYNYTHRGWIYGLRSGYDAAASGAGAVLMHRMLEDSFQRGDHTIDLGVGYFEAKRPWHTTRQPSFRYTHFPLTTPRAQLLRLKRLAQRMANRVFPGKRQRGG